MEWSLLNSSQAGQPAHTPLLTIQDTVIGVKLLAVKSVLVQVTSYFYTWDALLESQYGNSGVSFWDVRGWCNQTELGMIVKK